MNSLSYSPETLATVLLQDPVRPDPAHTIAAQKYRQKLLALWQIPEGSRVLEFGNGQGDFTVALANAVGLEGHVVAVDPGPLDDGTPAFRQARAHVLASPIGSRIDFVQDEPANFMANTEQTFDYIVFCHSIKCCPTLLIAEYGMVTAWPEAFPHVIAALAVNALESQRDGTSKRNIRKALTPKQIKTAVEEVGWRAVEEKYMTPESQPKDAWREVQMARHRMFSDEVKSLCVDEKVKSMLLGMQDALESAVGKLEDGVKSVRNMDVWAAKFER